MWKYIWQKYFFLILPPSDCLTNYPHLFSAPHQWFLKLSVTNETKQTYGPDGAMFVPFIYLDKNIFIRKVFDKNILVKNIFAKNTFIKNIFAKNIFIKNIFAKNNFQKHIFSIFFEQNIAAKNIFTKNIFQKKFHQKYFQKILLPNIFQKKRWGRSPFAARRIGTQLINAILKLSSSS